MKTLLLSIFSLITSSILIAQAPEKMTFQSVIRDGSDNLLTSSIVGVQISILQGSSTGVAVFIERHTPTTNTNGLATLEIGNGTTVAGNFSTIDWSSGSYYLKTEVDPSGGTTYSISGTSQLLSVPYALYSKTSGDGGFDGQYSSLTGAPTNVSFFTNDAGYITSANTLDKAYDQGGAGAGRSITTDAGAVQINNSGSNTTALEVNTSVANSTAYLANVSGVGVGFRSESTNSANSYAAIQGNTNSSNANNSAILGNNSGAGYGVSGQIPASATGAAGIYGSNLRTSGGHGVFGIGFNGTVGQSQNAQGFGVYGSNTNPATGTAPSLGIGVYGYGFNGVYGQTTDVTNGWAGYFTADLGVEGTGISIGGWNTVSDRRLKSNIVSIQSPIEKLMQINGVYYTLNTQSKDLNGTLTNHSHQQYGVIAQEVEAQFPDMVSEKQIFIQSGDTTVYKTVQYDQLIPVLIEALKEMNQKVEALEAELNELKNN